MKILRFLSQIFGLATRLPLIVHSILVLRTSASIRLLPPLLTLTWLENNIWRNMWTENYEILRFPSQMFLVWLGLNPCLPCLALSTNTICTSKVIIFPLVLAGVSSSIRSTSSSRFFSRQFRHVPMYVCPLLIICSRGTSWLGKRNNMCIENCETPLLPFANLLRNWTRTQSLHVLPHSVNEHNLSLSLSLSK